MQIGIITIGGREVGLVSLTHGEPDMKPPMLAPDADFDRELGPDDGGVLPEQGGRHHGHRFHGESRHESDEPHRHDHPRGEPLNLPDPHVEAGDRVYGRFAAARDRARDELKEKPWLNEKAVHIFAGENVDPNASTALWESAINRMAVRGTNLETELRRTREGGYYAGYRDDVSPETRRIIENSRERALNYSNISGYATDNASNQPGNNLAERDVASGRFREQSVHNREHFLAPVGESRDWHQRWQGMTYESETMRAARRSTETPTSVRAPDVSTQPGPVPGAEPKAFIMHHTSGRGTVQGVEDTLRQRGLGVEYIMDREGNITRFSGPGAANIMPEARYRKEPILGEGQPFLNNANVVGMEVIANDDKDVTPAQVAAAKAFIARTYPNTPVFGHGEVNPGHKEADEGMTIVNAIRADRARQAQHPQADDRQAGNFDPGTMVP